MFCGLYYDLIEKYRVTAELTQPLHVGSADNSRQQILVHPNDGEPFVQASGIAGVFRDAYEQFFGDAEGLFGSIVSDEKCYRKIIFTDGWFKKGSKRMELRPSVRLDPVSGTASASDIKGTSYSAGHKFEIEYMGAGAVIQFDIYIYGTAQSVNEDSDRICQIFAAISDGEIRFGGKKSSGNGGMKLTEVKFQRYDMKTVQGRKAWMAEAVTEPADIKELKDLVHPGKHLTAYTVRVRGKTEGPLLVKSIAVNEVGKGAPDYVNIRNAAGDYIIPGSSIKGAVRNRMQYIADYLSANRDDVSDGIMEAAFGRDGSRRDTGTAGNIYFNDAVVGSRITNDTMAPIHRIHIDKFTGGVINGALFSEKPVAGKINIEISVSGRKGQQDADRTCGLLLLALRDLAAGRFNLGSGFSVGKGFITVQSLTVTDGNKDASAEITFGKYMETDDPEGILTKCIRSLAGKE